MKPIIINPKSNFVVITYWWGRGNLNKNMQRPCPEELIDFPKRKIRRPPVKYEEMIERWQEACEKHSCNYLSQEYPEFAQKGMYQTAINFKPEFISQALRACSPRAVLYIDGDMLMRRYPHIFDYPDVDFMARGWNIDPRPSIRSMESMTYCFDPYVFETSGGTMFFGNTPGAKKLLKDWSARSEKLPGKADDRILSLVFNQQEELLALKVIQLPIEYLWLTIDDNINPYMKRYHRKRLFIEHPECLTGEDRAASEGAASDRIPEGYVKQVEVKIACDRRRSIPFYEYFLENKKFVEAFHEYLLDMEKYGVVKVIDYSQKFGVYNKVWDKHLKEVVEVKKKKSVVLVTKDKGIRGQVLVKKREIFKTIVKYLAKGIHVKYVPDGATSKQVDQLNEILKQEKPDVICKNLNRTVKRYKKSYTLQLSKKAPMYFRATDLVKKWFGISAHFADLEKHFNSIYLILSLARYRWY